MSDQKRWETPRSWTEEQIADIAANYKGLIQEGRAEYAVLAFQTEISEMHGIAAARHPGERQGYYDRQAQSARTLIQKLQKVGGFDQGFIDQLADAGRVDLHAFEDPSDDKGEPARAELSL